MSASQHETDGHEERAGFLSSLARRGAALAAAAFGQNGQKPSDTTARIWTADWVRKNPELAVRAIETLQLRVGDLEDQIKRLRLVPERWHVPANHPDPVRMSLLPPNTRFLLVRTGSFYTTTDKRNKWGRPIQLRDDGAEVSLHGSVRVIPFPPKEEK